MVTIKGRLYAIDELLELRGLIEKAVNSLDDTEAVIGTTLFPAWSDLLAKGYTFTAEDVANEYRCQYNGTLYKVLQPHTVQETWNPENAPSLFAKVLIPDDDVIYEWEQPDSTNGYKTGDMVLYDDTVYRSLIDNNVWCPAEYPQGWEVVEGETA